MKTFHQMRKRDGQNAVSMGVLYGCETMDEALVEFTENILKNIACGNEYGYYQTEMDLKEYLPDYSWQGEGYYLLPNCPMVGRSDFYPHKGAIIETYRDDVYMFFVKEIEEN